MYSKEELNGEIPKAVSYFGVYEGDCDNVYDDIDNVKVTTSGQSHLSSDNYGYNDIDDAVTEASQQSHLPSRVHAFLR